MVADPQAKRFALKVVKALARDYPDAECALNYETPVQLLVATILSAQCTDARVNIVTKDLFANYPTAEAMADLSQGAMEKIIASAGFFRNKAKNIRAACAALVDQHEGEVPQNLEELVELPGVGRKTANVVLGTAFGMPTGVVVDTHVSRITQRLGMTKQTDPVKIERDLMEQVPQKDWIDFSHRLIHHGRRICTARKPKCLECGMKAFCPRIGVET